MMTNAEILAPVGSPDALTAAVRCGADAVYLGAGMFNARMGARNFEGDELAQAIEYCHARGVKVYITLNTLVGDSEFPDALSLIKCACTEGADAFIIQDLGIAKAVRELAPDMPMHASTQMSVSTPVGFKMLESLGFKRAVLPRELSLSEIEEIRNNTELELEMFIHGALCMCVSGQCYLSSMLGGRSGNRGLCAQPCRLPFSAKGGTGYDLSLKDLCLVEHIPELAKLGINSFKIEGRMKRPEYVAAAVTACKDALAGRNDEEIKDNLRAVFSRSGFTDGYYTGRLGRHMFGTRGRTDVTAAAPPILKSLQALYATERASIPVSITLKAEVGKPLLASATTGRERVFVTSSYKVQTAKSHATEVSVIRTHLKKTGGTPFDVKMTDIDIDENINIPLSELNNIRRSVLAALGHKLCDKYKKECGDTSLLLPEKLPEFSRFPLKTNSEYPSNADLATPISSASHPPLNTNSKYPSNADLASHPPLNTNSDHPSNADLASHSASPPRPSTLMRISDVEQLPDNISSFGIDRLIVPLSTPEDKLSRIKKTGLPFGFEIPRMMYGYKGKIVKTLKDAKKSGASFVCAGTLDGVAVAKASGLPILGEFSLNAYNSHALDELKKLGVSAVTVSPELRLSDITTLRGDVPRGIFAYGRLPLMITRNCPVKNGTECRYCRGQRYLIDRKGVRFPVVCGDGVSEVLNSCPIYMADKQSEVLGLSFVILYFSNETKEKVTSVLSAMKKGLPPIGDFTRGLYFRGIK